MRTDLKTVRLKPEESRWVERFLAQNPWLASFSDLARLSVLDFIQRKGAIPIQPVTVSNGGGERPSFLWDYKLTKQDVRTQLASQPMKKKAWLVGRILEQAPFPEVWEYLTVKDIREALPQLRMSAKRKAHWQAALEAWDET
jgi:hypothetical protein